MRHSFDVELAQKYGVLESILLEYFYFWISKHKENNTNYFDENYWTYISKSDLAKLFPYATERQVKYALEKLIKIGILVTGNYNKTRFDRTIWYAFSNEGFSIVHGCLLEVDKNVQPIPVNRTVINNPPIIPQGKKEDKNESENEDDSEEASNNKELIGAVIDYLNKKGNTTFKATNKRTVSLINARVRQGYTLDDFKDVIWHCYCEWVQEPFKFKNGKMSDTYFRPSTLFNETNFENYLQEYRRLYGE